MPRYLSLEWIAAADAAGAAVVGPDEPVIVQHVVDGEPAYHVTVAADGVSVRPGASLSPSVTFTSTRAIAVAVARGDVSAQAAFMAGRLRVGGDLDALARVGDALSEFATAMCAVRDATDYD